MRTAVVISALASLALAAVEIDDGDASIKYKGASSSWMSEFARGGMATTSGDAAFEARFNFTGTQIQYLAPLFPFEIKTLVSIDGKSSVIDLRDPKASTNPDTAAVVGAASVASGPVWTSEVLENKEHEVVVSQAPGGKWALVDGFAYLRTAADTFSSPAPVQVLADESSGSQTGVKTTKNILIIALSLGVAGILIACFAILLCMRRLSRVQQTEYKVEQERRLANAQGALGPRKVSFTQA